MSTLYVFSGFGRGLEAAKTTDTTTPETCQEAACPKPRTGQIEKFVLAGLKQQHSPPNPMKFPQVDSSSWPGKECLRMEVPVVVVVRRKRKQRLLNGE